MIVVPRDPAARRRAARRLRDPGRLRRGDARAERRADPGRPGSRARPEGLLRLRLQRRPGHVGADVRAQGRPTSARSSCSTATPSTPRAARRPRRRPVLLPRRPLRLPRPLLLPRHGAPARRRRRLRVGVRDRPRGRPPRPAASSARATRSTRSARATPTGRTRRRSGSSCRPTATPASGRARCSSRDLEPGDIEEAIRGVRGGRRRPAPAAGRPPGRPRLVHARLVGAAPRVVRARRARGEPADCDTFSAEDL